MNKNSVTRGFISLMLLATLGCQRSGELRPPVAVTPASVSIRFPIPIVEAGQAPFYVAEAKGFYKAESITAKFEMGSKELNPVKTVASGQDDFGVLGGPDTLLVARSKGQPLVALAVLHRNSNFPCLLTLKSSGISQLSQLQGKKIGFFYGHISTDVLRNLLRRGGVKYQEVDVGFDYSQLIAGKIDAEWAFRVTAGLDLPAKGVNVNIINPASYGIVTHGYTVFTTEKEIRERPGVVLRFLRATLKGVKYTVEHPAEANDILVSKDPTIDKALSLKRLLLYNEVTSNSRAYPPGYMDRAMFQSTYDRLLEEGVIGAPFNVGVAYNADLLSRAQKSSL